MRMGCLRTENQVEDSTAVCGCWGTVRQERVHSLPPPVFLFKGSMDKRDTWEEIGQKGELDGQEL